MVPAERRAIDTMPAMSSQPRYDLFTDGACLGNPGPGGWAYILRDLAGGEEVVASGGDPGTTNQRMEAMAVLEALRSLQEPSQVHLHADSQYVTKGLLEWMDGWIARDWRNSSRKPVANQDLWRPLAELRQQHAIETTWIKGHAGHPENERCDSLAQAAAEIAARSG